MSDVTIRIPAPLRGFSGGRDEVGVSADNVAEALAALREQHPELLERVQQPDGQLREFVNLYLDQRDVRELGGLDAPLANGAVLAIIPAVAGGAS